MEQLDVVPLLFQIGYLTIKGYDPQRRLYTLSYPNFEVEESFLQYLVGEFSAVGKEQADAYGWRLIDALRVDFSLFRVEEAEGLKQALAERLEELAADHQVCLGQGDYQKQFRELIRQLATRNRVVVLVDEYDKPIIDNLENEAEARQIREVLKGFYGVLKGFGLFLIAGAGIAASPFLIRQLPGTRVPFISGFYRHLPTGLSRKIHPNYLGGSLTLFFPAALWALIGGYKKRP